ncbi:hypothetical protein C2845_PM01G29470 [Panicum miliaceum]|uniref:KIB1-4 beta-propeller domain-containing protein n=1 Tax=Panicum miliaceum TaxID=4540 RepID=A0A3L6TKF3_PANMI|nr:hypothetical protein C2845_PM01G29470 [Panicum miliaceum]
MRHGPRRREVVLVRVARNASNHATSTASLHGSSTRSCSLNSGWGSLGGAETPPPDLVSLIGWRVLAGDLRDYIRFRAVCPHWRSSTTCPRGHGIVDPRFHPRRWVLFPEGHGLYPGHGKLGGYVRFFNLSTGAFVRVRLSLFRDHCVLDSVDGILLLQRDQDTAIRLLHPFTCDIAEFPPLETLLPYVDPLLLGDKWKYLRNINAACISVGADGVVKLCYLWGSAMEDLKLPLPFQGRFYILHRPQVNSEPEVLQVDPHQQEDMNLGSPSLPPPKLIAKCPARTESYALLYYLIECNSEILVVTSRHGEQYSFYRLADLMLERTVPLTCIDGSTLFLSRRRSLHVSSGAFPTIVADTMEQRTDNPPWEFEAVEGEEKVARWASSMLRRLHHLHRSRHAPPIHHCSSADAAALIRNAATPICSPAAPVRGSFAGLARHQPWFVMHPPLPAQAGCPWHH